MLIESILVTNEDESGSEFFSAKLCVFLAALCVIAVTQRNAEEFLISCFVGKDTNKE
jgi:hypothetical protein